MKTSDHQFAFLKDFALLILWSDRKGYKITGGELWRSPETQKIYVEQEKSMTMDSDHLKRLAIDINLFIDGELTWNVEHYRPLGVFWKSLSPYNVWGGDFTKLVDAVHFARKLEIQ